MQRDTQNSKQDRTHSLLMTRLKERKAQNAYQYRLLERMLAQWRLRLAELHREVALKEARDEVVALAHWSWVSLHKIFGTMKFRHQLLQVSSSPSFMASNTPSNTTS